MFYMLIITTLTSAANGEANVGDWVDAYYSYPFYTRLTTCLDHNMSRTSEVNINNFTTGSDYYIAISGNYSGVKIVEIPNGICINQNNLLPCLDNNDVSKPCIINDIMYYTFTASSSNIQVLINNPETMPITEPGQVIIHVNLGTGPPNRHWGNSSPEQDAFIVIFPKVMIGAGVLLIMLVSAIISRRTYRQYHVTRNLRHCPYCARAIERQRNLAGGALTCSQCQHVFTWQQAREVNTSYLSSSESNLLDPVKITRLRAWLDKNEQAVKLSSLSSCSSSSSSQSPPPPTQEEGELEALKCEICMERIRNCRLECGHVFCTPCVIRVLRSQHPACPIDRKMTVEIPLRIIWEDDGCGDQFALTNGLENASNTNKEEPLLLKCTICKMNKKEIRLHCGHVYCKECVRKPAFKYCPVDHKSATEQKVVFL